MSTWKKITLAMARKKVRMCRGGTIRVALQRPPEFRPYVAKTVPRDPEYFEIPWTCLKCDCPQFHTCDESQVVFCANCGRLAMEDIKDYQNRQQKRK